MSEASTAISLTTNIAAVPGVGSRRAEGFRRLGIRCVADLVLHLPLRYEHETPEQTIAEAGEAVGAVHGGQAPVTVRGELAAVRSTRGRRPRVEATLEDDTGTMLLTWFNAPWLRRKLHPGMTVRAWGRGARYGDALQIVNPAWEPLEEGAADPPRGERHRPVYPASERVSSVAVARAVDAVLDAVLPLLEDHLHEAYRARAALPTLAEAFRMVHRPESPDEAARGRRRLAFDELLLLQIGVMLKRRHRRERLRAVALRRTPAIDEHILARFPFALTDAQREVIDEISGDLATTPPMNRLLQGDVGAGKTVVALHAMLLAVASRHQAALMAPTELLAEQHFASIRRMLEGSDVTIALLTGSLPAAPRARLLEDLEAGAIDLVVGTHALLTEHVRFASLAVAVVDEQHRFGVHQRATLRGKANDPRSIPHTLVMTATPIPRTLSLTVFGDLDISVIRALPPGRKPIVMKVVPGHRADEAYGLVAERVAAGEQAYVVVPVIEESQSGLTDVHGHLERLRAGPLRAARVEAVHGRLKADEREAIMQRFRDGEIDALVATTVIEVGVDVSNATVMVIEHADRFGLAQLHQLRGRVGRGGRQSVCVLVADPITDDGRARVEAIAATQDGFRIAERDLEIRGPGELFGARQSGLAPFRVAQLPRDLELLQMARRDARTWVEENPTLAGERDALLRRRLLKAHGEALGLGDVA